MLGIEVTHFDWNSENESISLLFGKLKGCYFEFENQHGADEDLVANPLGSLINGGYPFQFAPISLF